VNHRYKIYFIDNHHLKKYLPIKLAETNNLEEANRLAYDLITKQKHLKYVWIQDDKKNRFAYIVFNQKKCATGNIWERI